MQHEGEGQRVLKLTRTAQRLFRELDCFIRVCPGRALLTRASKAALPKGWKALSQPLGDTAMPYPSWLCDPRKRPGAGRLSDVRHPQAGGELRGACRPY